MPALQVPFSVFAPLMALEVASHAFCSTAFGLPMPWVAARYLPALPAALTMSAAVNACGRRQFCRLRGLPLDGLPASSAGDV